MNQQLAFTKSALEHLREVSKEMLSFAENDQWDRVLELDNKRVELLKNKSTKKISTDQTAEKLTKAMSDNIIKDIFELDSKIRELASSERKSVMEKEIRQQAQVLAQSRYRQALTPDVGT